eukprot:UN15232
MRSIYVFGFFLNSLKRCVMKILDALFTWKGTQILSFIFSIFYFSQVRFMGQTSILIFSNSKNCSSKAYD